MAGDRNEGILTASIDDYLLALAESVQKAQTQLSRMRIPSQAGQPAIAYHLPRLDFELKISFEVARGADEGLELRMRPLSVHGPGARQVSSEAASIIKGSFVAVPSDGGRPPMVAHSTIAPLSSTERKWEIVVVVQSVTGELEPGIEVQLNIDRDRSRALNEAAGIPEEQRSVHPGTRILEGRVFTNNDGRATTIFMIDPDETKGAHVVLTIDACGETETIVFKAD